MNGKMAFANTFELVSKFDEFYLDLNTTWATRDETDNYD